MKIVDTQYAITKHTDRKHIHLHVVANLVDNGGRAISDSYLGFRGKRISQKLTQQHKLVPALKKNLELTNYEALHISDANKYKVYDAILQALPQCKTLDELEKKLKPQGIEMKYKYKGQTEEKQGVSFKIGEYVFKGSKVDREFSLGNLEKTFAVNQQQTLQNEQKMRQRTAVLNQNFQREERPNAALIPNRIANEIANEIGKVIEAAIKPELNFDQPPTELLKESQRNRKKQSQSQRRGLRH